MANSVKILNRDLDVKGAIKVNGIVVVDSSGNIDAPVTTTNATFSGNTTLGDSSADAVSINGTTTALAPITVGVNDTGHDVKFFGATSGKSLLWDESADKLIVTGDAQVTGTTTLGATTIGGAAATVTLAGATTVSSTLTVGVDDTGHDVKFFGATSGKFLLWDESIDTLQVAGYIAASTTGIQVTGLAGAGALFGYAGSVPESLSGPSALSVTIFKSNLTTTGADAFTLAAGNVIGQVKRVQMIVDGGDGTLTFNSTATIVFADVGDVAELVWTGAIWVPIDLYNCADGATAPVYTPA